MVDLNKLFHQLADEGDHFRRMPEEDFVARVAFVKGLIARKKEEECRRRTIDLERDLLLARIADDLGICTRDFPTFFDHIDNITDE